MVIKKFQNSTPGTRIVTKSKKIMCLSWNMVLSSICFNISETSNEPTIACTEYKVYSASVQTVETIIRLFTVFTPLWQKLILSLSPQPIADTYKLGSFI